MRVADVLRTVEAVAGGRASRSLVMTYWNPVDRYGVDAFAARSGRGRGAAGLITPDLTPEEAGPWLAAAAAHDLDRGLPGRAQLVGERIELITAGVPRLRLRGLADGRYRSPGRGRQPGGRPGRAGSGKPPACRSPSASASATAPRRPRSPAFADGVIVGSAFVQRLLDAPSQQAGVAAVAELAAELANAVAAPAPRA